MLDAITSLLPFVVFFAVLYFFLIKPRQKNLDVIDQPAPISASGMGGHLLTRYSSFEVHRTVPDGVQPAGLVEALVRASPGSRSGTISLASGESIDRVMTAGNWDIRISTQKSGAKQKVLYRAIFDAPYLRLGCFGIGLIMFLFLSGNLYVVDVLAGMRDGGVDVSSPVARFVAWTVVVLLKLVIPLFLIMFSISPNLFDSPCGKR